MAIRVSSQAILGPLALEAKWLAKKKFTSLNIIGSSNKKKESRRKKGKVSRSDGEVAGVHI